MVIERRSEAVQKGDGAESRASYARPVTVTGRARRSTKQSLDLFDEDPREGCDRAWAVSEEAAQSLVNTWINAGTYTLRVRQTDGAGNVSVQAAYSFTLDKTAAAPRLMLTNDTGTANNDRITNDGRLTVTGLETGATTQYSPNGVGNWASSFTAGVGVNTVYARQIDLAGNPSASSAPLTFTLDTVASIVQSVTLPTTGTYRVGDTLRISVKYSEAVRFGGSGTPAIALTFGSTTRQAVYESGDGTDTIVFAYTIRTGDAAATGVLFGRTIILGGRTLRDLAGNNASLALTLPGSLPSIVV